MTQYILHISNFAWHFRGHVEGPSPSSCHGGKTMKDRKWVCSDEGHELPSQVRWDVEAEWTEARHERWAAARFEGAGPQQFGSKREVMDRAVIQFLGGSGGLCEEVSPAEPGDELWYGWVNPGDGRWDDLTDPSDRWGMMIARKDEPATPAGPPADAARPEPAP